MRFQHGKYEHRVQGLQGSRWSRPSRAGRNDQTSRRRASTRSGTEPEPTRPQAEGQASAELGNPWPDQLPLLVPALFALHFSEVESLCPHLQMGPTGYRSIRKCATARTRLSGAPLQPSLQFFDSFRKGVDSFGARLYRFPLGPRF